MRTVESDSRCAITAYSDHGFSPADAKLRADVRGRGSGCRPSPARPSRRKRPNAIGSRTSCRPILLKVPETGPTLWRGDVLAYRRERAVSLSAVVHASRGWHPQAM
jgi:hypothetical protein